MCSNVIQILVMEITLPHAFNLGRATELFKLFSYKLQ